MSTPSAEWTRRPERGSLSLLRIMVWMSLRLGRGFTRGLLRLAAAYFLASGGKARRCSQEFLARALGRAPTLAEQYQLFFNFAATVHDRIYFLKGRFDLFDVRVHGAGLLDERGALLMGAHLGSFEVLRASGRHTGHRRVVMAMHAQTTRRINAVLAAVDPAAAQDIVSLGRVDSMLELADRLDAGALVGVLADRTLGDEPVMRIPVLGEPAPLPTGPMRMAAALRRRVFFMVGLYRGANRYEIRFEPLADFTAIEGLTRAERERRVEEAIAAYARRIEHYAREAPGNWFNFHDFWGRAA